MEIYALYSNQPVTRYSASGQIPVFLRLKKLDKIIFSYEYNGLS